MIILAKCGQVYLCLFNSTAPEVLIVEEHGRPIFEKYYKAESTIQLTCFVRHVSMIAAQSVVLWSHGNNTLNYDVTRGGIR